MRDRLRWVLAAALCCAGGSVALTEDTSSSRTQVASTTPVSDITIPDPLLTLPRNSPIETSAPAEIVPPVAPPAAAPSVPAPPAAVVSGTTDAHPLAGVIRSRLAALPALSARADKVEREERAVLVAFYAARGERPLWVDANGLGAKGQALASELGQADDWGLASAEFVTPRLGPASGATEIADAEIRLTALALKYARHARGGRIDPTQLSNYIDRTPPLLAPGVVLDGLAAASEPGAYLRGTHPRHPQFEKLRQVYLAMRAGKLPEEPPQAEAPAEAPAKGKNAKAKYKTASADLAPAKGNLRKVLYNMEMWRWMPEDLGPMYVAANIPEFTVRVVKAGTVVHAERIISGKTENQTPIFSDAMETIVFQPFWGVPDSIKVKEVLPGLLRGGGMLEKNGLRIAQGNREIDPNSIDWRVADIRHYHVFQPPGGANVLGVVKFLFPNKHQVYMHDTPTKNLFNASQRTFSHGCIRVRNPVRLAEMILEHDKGWDARRVGTLVSGGPQNNNVHLATKIPVHVTYFTAVVDDEGKAKFLPDVYGHESRIQMGLDGKAHLIVKKKEDLGPVRAEVISRLGEARQAAYGPTNWLRTIFGGF
jgi:murein L,D-transpeptidase YcbB/YkuD